MVFFYLFVLMVGFAYIGRFVIEYECKITILFYISNGLVQPFE